MEESQFWQIIECSRDEAIRICPSPDGLKGAPCSTLEFEDALVECLREHLDSIPVDEIAEFRREIERKKHELYRHDLWAIAYIIHGGCSDDGFDAFRNWVLFQGRDFFLDVLNNPLTVTEIAEPGQTLSFELVSILPIQIYEARSGLKYLPTIRYEVGYEPSGEPWEEQDLPRLYPTACRKFKLN